jgi:hypothetical protein
MGVKQQQTSALKAASNLQLKVIRQIVGYVEVPGSERWPNFLKSVFDSLH